MGQAVGFVAVAAVVATPAEQVTAKEQVVARGWAAVKGMPVVVVVVGVASKRTGDSQGSRHCSTANWH
jgi:hypothetical protein